MTQTRLSQSIKSLIQCRCRPPGPPIEGLTENDGRGDGTGRGFEPLKPDSPYVPPLPVTYINMESGFVGLTLPYGAEPGTVTYPTDIRDDYNSRFAKNPWIDEINIENHNQYIVRDYTPGMESSSWATGNKSEYIEGIDHSTKPGKAGWMFQCLMGCPDCTSNLMDLLNSPNRGIVDYGLYTSTTQNYYLIRIQNGEVDAGLITFTAAGQDLLADLQNDFGGRISRTLSSHKELRQREGYLMEQAVNVVAWFNLGSINMVGAPLYHGMRFSWDGDVAGIVTHVKHYHDFAAGEVAYWEAHRYTLTIFESGGIPSTINWTENEVKKWAPRHGRDELVLPSDVSRMQFIYWLDAGESYSGGYPLDWTDELGIPIDLYIDDNGLPVILAYRLESAWRGGGYYTWVRNNLDATVHHCGNGFSAGSLEAGNQNTFRAYFIRGDNTLSFDRLKQSEGQAGFYAEDRTISSSTSRPYGPRCADPQGFSEPEPPDANYKGRWCDGAAWDLNEVSDDCANPVNKHLAGDFGESRLTIRQVFTNNPHAGHCCVIIARGESEGWVLIHYATKPDSSYFDGYQNHRGFISGEQYDKDGNLGAGRITRVPGIEFNFGVTEFNAVTNWPIVINNSVSAPTVAGEDHGWNYKDVTTGVVTVKHHVFTKDNLEVVRDDYMRPSTDVEWGAYNALFDITRFGGGAYPYLDYIVVIFRALVSGSMLYTGDLTGGDPSPADDSNDPNLPATLLSYPGLFVGRS